MQAGDSIRLVHVRRKIRDKSVCVGKCYVANFSPIMYLCALIPIRMDVIAGRCVIFQGIPDSIGGRNI